MWPEKLTSMPAIKSVMTPFPFSVELGDPVTKAREMMSVHEIRHLPVVEDGRLIGVISQRDLLGSLESAALPLSPGLRVVDIPREETHVVDLSEPLDRVLMYMAQHRIGATLVTKDGRLAGIFTLTDACTSFAESLRQRFPRRGGDEAA